MLKLLYEEEIDPTNPYLVFVKDAYKSGSKEDLQAQVPKNDGRKDEAFVTILRRLKGHGISDPNVDVHLGVVSNDIELVRHGVESGADLSITNGRVINSYRDLLKKIAPNELAIFDDDSTGSPVSYYILFQIVQMRPLKVIIPITPFGKNDPFILCTFVDCYIVFKQGLVIATKIVVAHTRTILNRCMKAAQL